MAPSRAYHATTASAQPGSVPGRPVPLTAARDPGHPGPGSRPGSGAVSRRRVGLSPGPRAAVSLAGRDSGG
eukprot:263972-Hanusia_phi.AAC.2